MSFLHRILPAAALLVIACGERTSLTGVVGTGRSGGPPGSAVVDARLLGRWSTVRVFEGSDGSLHSSQTIWTFGADGTASRKVVATNISFGLSDEIVTAALWRREGSAVAITWLPEGTGAARFEYFFQDMRLILGGIVFDRS